MKKIYFVVTFLVVTFIYFPIITHRLLVGGDTYYVFSSMINNYYIFPFAWVGTNGNGFGAFVGPFLYAQILSTLLNLLVSIFHLTFSTSQKLVMVIPFIALSSLSSWYAVRQNVRNTFMSVFAAFVYAANTYILLLVSGGQLPLALAYAIAPMVLYSWSVLKNKLEIKTSLQFAFFLALQIVFDIRFVYVILIALFIFSILHLNVYLRKEHIIQRFFLIIIIPAIVVIGLHAFWLLPTVLVHSNPLKQLGSAYTTTNAVQYFSFAKFEDTMGLLHPNWPENVFGFTHFMRPEFLLLPIFAFASLLFVKKTKDIKEQEQKEYILFFALLGLIGIFLAKGANDPFGGVYLWLFAHVPGFVMFRDPTKWYLLIALSYSMLIPFTVSHMYELIKNKAEFLSVRLLQGKIFNFQNLFVILVVGYLLFLIRPALLGQLGGTFQPHTLPQDYVTFEKYMVGEKNFSRVLWIPSLERFGFYSPTHPAVGVEELYQVTSVQGVLQMLSQKQTQTFLQQRGIGYIVVPYDAEGELFVKDRKYDNTEYLKTIEFLRKLPWLREIPGFGRIHVFQVSNAKDLFWVTNSSSTKITYTPINPTKYLLHVANAQKGNKIVFASTYDSHWQLTIGRSRITPVPFEQSLNMFVLPQSGTYTATVYYTPQKWVDIGLVISLVTLLGIVVFSAYSFYSARQMQ